jgi:hypothetical protein
MFDHPLSLATRASVTITALVFAVVAHRVLFRRSPRAGAVFLGGAFVIAAAFSHLRPLMDALPRVLPIGFVVAFGAVIGSLVSARARAAFDAATDAEVRLLLSFRGIFGGLVIALAATGHLPFEFGIAAGIGDLAVTWIAFALPARLDADGPRWARLLAHGVGLIDMLFVLVAVVTFVRPWSLAHGNAAVSMTLPWLAVPLMFAINAHGIRAAIRRAEVVGDGPEPARGLRGALS